MTTHLTYCAIGSLLLLAGIVIWIGGSDTARRNMYLLGIVVLIAGACLIGYGAHHGSELVYEYGTGVQMPELPDSPGELITPAPSEILPQVKARLSPLELHLFIAGCAIAILAAAVGLSIRLSNVAWENRFAEEKAVAAGYRPAGKIGQEPNLLSIPVIYPGAFWLIGVLLLVGAAVLGLSLVGVHGPRHLLSEVRTNQANDEWRPVLHIYYGASLIALTVVLGMVMKIWPRRRVIMGMLCTLLVMAVVGQAWTGILMLFDGNTGSVLRFNRLPANRPIAVIPVKPLAPATRPAEGVQVPATTHTLETPAPAATRHLEPLD
jgi:hypothetical protein